MPKELLLLLVQSAMLAAASKLADKDKDSTGADDAFANVLKELAPVVPDLISGHAGDNATDKAALAAYETLGAFLRSRGKLEAK